jgi:hypothetical protein
MVLLMSLAPAQAQNGPGPQVDAAKSDAVESLKRQIIVSHINSDLTVADLIGKVGGETELERTLASAEELGGPRWLGDQAVQVRLSIDGSRIARMLLNLVQAHPRQSPITADALQRQLKWWSDRIFSATGTSTGAGDISRLRPPLSDRAWWNVSDADRRRALVSARDNAVNRIIQSLAAIQLDDDKKLGPAVGEPTVAQPLRQWLDNQPIKEVQFNDDLTVKLTLADLGSGIWPVLRSNLGNQRSVPVPSSDADWERLHQQVIAAAASAIGVGMVQPPDKAGPAPQATLLPMDPPAWSREQAEAEATSPQDGSPLHTSRRAEALAVEKLRDQINRLPLSAGITVGIAAGKDPRIEQAIARSVSRARPSKVDYGPKGAVTVHVILRLADLWALMSGQE